MLLYNNFLLWVILCRFTKLRTSSMYILFSPHHEKTIIFVIWSFCGECETLFSFFFFFLFFVCLFVFCICPKLRKDKSNRYVRMKRRHLFWRRRTSDKTGDDYRHLAATKRNTEMTHISHHIKVDDIIPFFYLHFSNGPPRWHRGSGLDCGRTIWVRFPAYPQRVRAL